MRWDGQGVGVDDGALPGLQRLGLVRSVRTPHFDGITFHEVLCKSALNKVPEASNLPFRFTVNGFRGCSHACRYCFARPTHEYLDFDCGNDFDTQVVVKINVADVLRRELARRSWTRETVALGTNTDPYQRAEGRYALMPGIIGALADSGTPFSILTKGTLLRRDLPLIAAAAAAGRRQRCRLAGHRRRRTSSPRRARHPDARGSARTDPLDPRCGLGLPRDGGAGAAAADRFRRTARRPAGSHRRGGCDGGDGVRPAPARLDARMVHGVADAHASGVGGASTESCTGAVHICRRTTATRLRTSVAPLLARHGLEPDNRPFAMRSAPAVQSAGALQPTLF